MLLAGSRRACVVTGAKREVTKLLLAFDAAGRWSSARYAKKSARMESGSTSIRVSKATLARLRHLARDVARESGWTYREPSLSELVDWLSSGIVFAPDVELARACKKSIAKTHATLLEEQRDQERAG